MDATRLIIVRHGETAWNVDLRIQGHTDIALNGQGRLQALQVGQALSGEALDAVYASDLSRAHETAQAIARPHGLSVGAHAGLRERAFGEFEGRTFDEIAALWPDQSRAWRQRVPEFAPAGGESLLVFRARVLDALREIAARHVGGQIACVAHGGVLDLIYRAAAGLDLQAPRTWQVPNAAVNRLLWTADREGAGLSLVGWGDVSHLEQEQSQEGSRDDKHA